jgi:hypothetical protein
MKTIIFFLNGILLSLYLNSQTTERQVISSSGSGYANAVLNFNFTSGEPVAETFEGSNLIFIQGFQQPLDSTALLLTVTSSNTLCGSEDGTASVSVSGGTAPYSYLWTTGDTVLGLGI